MKYLVVGSGGPGYTIKCEINPKKHTKGALSMAHAGKNTGGSQFFIATVVFDRSGNGDVLGFTASNGRTKGVWFRKQR